MWRRTSKPQHPIYDRKIEIKQEEPAKNTIEAEPENHEKESKSHGATAIVEVEPESAYTERQRRITHLIRSKAAKSQGHSRGGNRVSEFALTVMLPGDLDRLIRAAATVGDLSVSAFARYALAYVVRRNLWDEARLAYNGDIPEEDRRRQRKRKTSPQKAPKTTTPQS